MSNGNTAVNELLVLVEILQEFGSAKEIVIDKVMEKFAVEQDSAKEYVEKYWKG